MNSHHTRSLLESTCFLHVHTDGYEAAPNLQVCSRWKDLTKKALIIGEAKPDKYMEGVD